MSSGKAHTNPFDKADSNPAGEPQGEEAVGTPVLPASPRARLDALQSAHAAHNLIDAALLLDLLEGIVGELE